MSDGWEWWAGTEEFKTVGPCATREEAIEEALDREFGFEWLDEGKTRFSVAFEVIEARQDPLRLADWIPGDLVEDANERIYESDRASSEYDDGPIFEASKEQEADLRKRVEQACDDWQAAHGLVFQSNTFSDTRNEEWVRIEREVSHKVAP